MSKMRNRRKPARMNGHPRPKGTNRKVMNWPINSSTTASGASEFPSNGIDLVDAHIPTRQKIPRRTAIPAVMRGPPDVNETPGRAATMFDMPR
jgi:hypothetical protein